MRDATEARLWAEHRSAYAAEMVGLLKGIGKILRDAKIAMKLLNEIEFDAPWRRPQRPESNCR